LPDPSVHPPAGAAAVAAQDLLLWAWCRIFHSPAAEPSADRALARFHHALRPAAAGRSPGGADMTMWSDETLALSVTEATMQDW